MNKNVLKQLLKVLEMSIMPCICLYLLINYNKADMIQELLGEKLGIIVIGIVFIISFIGGTVAELQELIKIVRNNRK